MLLLFKAHTPRPSSSLHRNKQFTFVSSVVIIRFVLSHRYVYWYIYIYLYVCTRVYENSYSIYSRRGLDRLTSRHFLHAALNVGHTTIDREIISITMNMIILNTHIHPQWTRSPRKPPTVMECIIDLSFIAVTAVVRRRRRNSNTRNFSRLNYGTNFKHNTI